MTKRRFSVVCFAWLLMAAALVPSYVQAAGAFDEATGRLDLNAATLEEIESLPISAELAKRIFDYREQVGILESFYDLNRVDGMTAADLEKLSSLVATIEPGALDPSLARYEASFRQIQRFLSQEGASEGVADEYLDRLRDPSNINEMTLYELQSFQNVSPVDAAAIIRARERLGSIESSRQLRGAEGLSFWGYRNLRDYVVYNEDEESKEFKLHGDLQLTTSTRPFTAQSPDDFLEVSSNGSLEAINARLVQDEPSVTSKLRLRMGSQLRGGVLTFRNVNEQEFDETLKFFAEYRTRSRGRYRLDRAIAGNFRVSFGQGLVMDNTDFFLPRKTGYGFNKRPNGITGDLSRSYEFALNGGAVEASLGRVHVIAFGAGGKKDALFNDDGSLNRYFITQPRLTNEDYANVSAVDDPEYNWGGEIRRKGLYEEVYGGNLKFELAPGSYVGLSGYEARYDDSVKIDPRRLDLFLRPDLLQGRDSEYFTDYQGNLGVDDDGNEVNVNFRRVLGADFQTVYKNVAVQGEYAKLDANPNGGLGGVIRNAPEAYVVSAYIQEGRMNFLALYRDYDVGFDNPYARGFSNNRRYDKTLGGDSFRLTNPFLADLSLYTPQMKPERGLFMTTRYQVTRNFTITGLDYDQWTRVADGQDHRRWTLRAEYRPIFPLRFRVRQRYSSRSEFGVEDTRKFQSWDTRIESIYRLGGFDEVRLLYSATSTNFANRPRLSGTAEPNIENNPFAQAASPGQFLQARLVHNVNENLAFTWTTLRYSGFFWTFEDNEFSLLDGNNGFRNWLLVRTRLSDRLMLRAKITHDTSQSVSNIEPRGFDNDPSTQPGPRGTNIRTRQTDFRLQLDYTF